MVNSEWSRRSPSRSTIHRPPFTDSSELPAFQLGDRLLECAALFVATGFGPQPLERAHREVEREGIMLGAGHARGIVGEGGPFQLVGGKAVRDVLPTLHAVARVRLRESP